MIALSDIHKQYGSKVLYKGASLQIKPGEKIGLVGPNGAGKTSIFRIIMGEQGIDSGTVTRPDKWVIGYFSQEVGEMKGRTALEEVMAGAGKVSELASRLKALEDELTELSSKMDDEASMERMNTVIERMGELQLEFESRGGYTLESRAREVLTGLGIGPDDHSARVESFSGGWKMRIELAKMLVLQPDVLLMDEPTNHLDLESILWLEEWLRNFKGALVMTSHDREFMNRIVSRVVEVANQTVTSYSGNYDFYEREREIRREQLLAQHKKQQDMLAKEEEFIARFAARASHAAQVQSRIKKLEKIDRVEIPTEERSVSFEFPVPPRGGNDVVRFKELQKIWKKENGTDHTVFAGATGLVKRLDRVAVVGVNGAGKSTFLKLVAGQAEPTAGDLSVGAGINIGYFSQHALDVLNPNKTIFDEIHDRIPEATIGYVRNLLGAFLFSGDDVYKKVAVLSGGEKSRVVLATLLARPNNLLILDEPTNHLDIRSREMLLEALKGFEGTVLLVSHDRHFLRQVTNKVFELGKGELRVYEGTYNEYLDRRA
ncbi:MAG: ABC-F family ATP-binding cassette domain-containing protein [Oligoflexia bacterium]